MPNVALEKPGAAAAAIVGGGFIGTGASATFTIQVQDFECTHFVKIAEATGDGNIEACFVKNEIVYGNYTFIGAMRASEAVGLSNLAAAANVATNVTFHIGGDQALDTMCLVERIRIRWRRNNPFVGVVLEAILSEKVTDDVLETANA